MSHARLSSCTLIGVRPVRVEVEIHVGSGLPTVQLVGLADTEVREARERVRCALLSGGLPFPHDRRVTINLAPADLPKDSGRFDLPIALALLVVSGHLEAEALRGHVFAGELALNGELRPIRAALPMVLACASQGWTEAWVLPTAKAVSWLSLSFTTTLRAAWMACDSNLSKLALAILLGASKPYHWVISKPL